MAPINEKKDNFNQWLLFCGPLKIFCSKRKREQLSKGTPAERALAVNTRMMVLFGFTLLILFPSSWTTFLPETPPPPKPKNVTEEIGTVQSVQAQEAFLHSSSTVETNIGFYQVTGTVSAARGDRVFIKKAEKENGALYPPDFLCVESQKQTKCYPLR